MGDVLEEIPEDKDTITDSFCVIIMKKWREKNIEKKET